MGIKDETMGGVDAILAAPWNTRKGTVVPETEDVVMKNGAVLVDATYAYADLANSSKLAQSIKKEVTGKIIRAYVNAAARLFRNYGGAIRSFDGDRVMAVFIGNDKNSNATRAALAINWAASQYIQSAICKKWEDLSRHWVLRHCIGIDSGEAMIVRGGVRDNSDLISIGSAPNVAAKLSDLRDGPSIYVTDAVYQTTSHKKTAKGESMWKSAGKKVVGGAGKTCWSSSWYWQP